MGVNGTACRESKPVHPATVRAGGTNPVRDNVRDSLCNTVVD